MGAIQQVQGRPRTTDDCEIPTRIINGAHKTTPQKYLTAENIQTYCIRIHTATESNYYRELPKLLQTNKGSAVQGKNDAM